MLAVLLKSTMDAQASRVNIFLTEELTGADPAQLALVDYEFTKVKEPVWAILDGIYQVLLVLNLNRQVLEIRHLKHWMSRCHKRAKFSLMPSIDDLKAHCCAVKRL